MNPITARPASDVAAPAPAPARRSFATYLTWAGPAAATAVLGLYKVGGPQLWRDELATWSAATRTLPQLWAMLHNIDAVLGFYYFGLHLWMSAFGSSPTAMRLPSTIAMTAAAAVVALIGRRLGGNRAGLASGLVFAVIPSVSRYAQEARPYAFAIFFAALATLMFLRAMEQPRWSRWVIYALVLGACGAANLITVCVAAAHLAIVLWDFVQRTVRFGREDEPRSLPAGRLDPVGSPLLLVGRFGLAAVLGAVLVAPLVIQGHHEQSWQIGQQPTPHVAELVGISGGLWQELFASFPVAGLVLLLAVVALFAGNNWQKRLVAGYALAFAIAPVVAVWVISRGPTSYWTFRYMLFSLVGWSVGAGLSVTYLAERVKGSRLARLSGSLSPALAVPAVLVVLVALAGVHDQIQVRGNVAHNLYAYPEQPANGTAVDYKAAAEVIEAYAKPGDVIAYEVDDQNHYQVDTALDYYLRGKKNMPAPVFQAETQVQSGTLQPVQCVDPAACLSGTPRIWVVYVDHLDSNPYSAIPWNEAALLGILGYQTQVQYQENGITVALLTV